MLCLDPRKAEKLLIWGVRELLNHMPGNARVESLFYLASNNRFSGTGMTAWNDWLSCQLLHKSRRLFERPLVGCSITYTTSQGPPQGYSHISYLLQL